MANLWPMVPCTSQQHNTPNNHQIQLILVPSATYNDPGHILRYVRGNRYKWPKGCPEGELGGPIRALIASRMGPGRYNIYLPVRLLGLPIPGGSSPDTKKTKTKLSNHRVCPYPNRRSARFGYGAGSRVRGAGPNR